MAVQIPATAVADARSGASQAGYPDLWPLLLAIAAFESGYRPDAIGDGGCSYGYLQFNRCGGLGDPYSPAQLLDGVTNMRLGAGYIGGRLAAGSSLWDALQPWSVRPSAVPFYSRLLAEGIEGVGGLPSSVDGPGETADGTATLARVVVIGGLVLLTLIVLGS